MCSAVVQIRCAACIKLSTEFSATHTSPWRPDLAPLDLDKLDNGELFWWEHGCDAHQRRWGSVLSMVVFPSCAFPFRRQNSWKYSGRPLSVVFINMQQVILCLYCCHKFLLTVAAAILQEPSQDGQDFCRRFPRLASARGGMVEHLPRPHWACVWRSPPGATTPFQEVRGRLAARHTWRPAGGQGKLSEVRYQRSCGQSRLHGALKWNGR